MTFREIILRVGRSMAFAALVVIFEVAALSLAGFFEDRSTLISGLAIIVHSLIAIPAAPFFGRPWAIYAAIFVFWAVIYFAFGLAHPAIKKWLKNPRTG